MLVDSRTKVLKKLKVSTQSKVSASNPPRYNSMNTEEMQVLWITFVKSNQFKELSPPTSLPLEYNYQAMILWLNFLINYHIDTPVDAISTIEKDMSLSLKSKTRDVLHNLRMYKVLPSFKVSNVSFRLKLDTPSTNAKKLNSHIDPKIFILLEFVPSKKKVVDFKDINASLKNTSVDFLLDTKLNGYLFNNKDRWLSYNKPVDLSKLIELPEYQWFYKDKSNLRFRHNGNSLVVRIDYTYQGSLPISETDYFLRNIDKMMSKAIRAIP